MNELKSFELSVMTATARLRGKAYGVSIMEEVATREKKEVAYGAVHVTLSRLVEKGFLSAEMGEPTPERGGRRKRFYEVTGKGQEALNYTRSTLTNRFMGIPVFQPKTVKG